MNVTFDNSTQLIKTASRYHPDKHSYDIWLKLAKDLEDLSFKVFFFLFFSSDGHLDHWGRTILTIVVESHLETSCNI